MEFVGVQGETLIKNPGSINGYVMLEVISTTLHFLTTILQGELFSERSY